MVSSSKGPGLQAEAWERERGEEFAGGVKSGGTAGGSVRAGGRGGVSHFTLQCAFATSWADSREDPARFSSL